MCVIIAHLYVNFIWFFFFTISCFERCLHNARCWRLKGDTSTVTCQQCICHVPMTNYMQQTIQYLFSCLRDQKTSLIKAIPTGLWDMSQRMLRFVCQLVYVHTEVKARSWTTDQRVDINHVPVRAYMWGHNLYLKGGGMSAELRVNFSRCTGWFSTPVSSHNACCQIQAECILPSPQGLYADLSKSVWN